MGRKNQSENKYFKNRRNKKLWHRLLLAAGSIVVFITTYMLILPAITAEVGTIELFDESLSSGSAVTPEENETYIIIEETTEETVEETTEEPTEDITSEETTDGAAEALSEETSDQALEETTSGSGSGGTDTSGGGGTASEASSEISEEETEETTESEFAVSAENMLIALLGEAGIDLADETNASSDDPVTFSGSGTDGTYVCTYDPDTGNFKLTLVADLVIKLDDVVDSTKDEKAVQAAKDILNTNTLYTSELSKYNNIYTFSLPEGIVLTDSLLYESGNTKIYQGADYEKYVYYFTKNADGTYDVVIVFKDEYLDDITTTNITGTLKIDAYIDSSYYDSETKTITVGKGSLSEEITITSENITWDENETLYSDLIMYKTASYNSSEKTITYTIRVLTTKGTGGEVTISDVVTSSSALTGLSSNGLSSITYSTGNMWAYKDSSLSTVEDSLTYMGDIVPISEATAGKAYYYYDSDGNMIIVLPELEAADTNSDYYNDTCYNWYSSYYTYYNEYYITYTYDVSPDSTTTYNINNTATGTSTDETTGADLKDESTADIKISSTKLISKSGSLSGDTITWTITVGDGSTSLAGYVLTDTMFSDVLLDDIKITDSNGYTAIYGDNYDYTATKDNDGYAISITFNQGTYYTITYTQTVEAGWSDTTYKNTSTLTYGKYSEDSTAYVKVEGYSDKCLIKDSSGMTENSDGTYTLSWTAGIEVPKEGIPAGTTFTDYIEGTDHYITYAQALAIADAIQKAFSEENVTDIYFSTQSGGNMWYIDSSKWVSLEEITNNPDTYADTKFYLYKFTTVYDIAYDTSAAAVAAYSAGEEITSAAAVTATSVDLAEEDEETASNSLGLDPVMQAVIAQALDLSAEETEEEAEEVITYGFTANEPLALAAVNTITPGTNSEGETVYYYSTNEITFDYYTTADVSSVTTDRTYYNYIFNEGNYAADSTTYSKNVVKYGVNQYGYLQTGDLTISTSTTENEISWVVKVNLADYTEYTITDAIPSGAAIETVSVLSYESSKDSDYTVLDSAGGTTSLYEMDFSYEVSDTVNAEDGSTNVVVKIAGADDKTVNTVYIKFNCKVTVEPDGEDTKKSVSYANSVKVTANGSDYGDADETITVSYTESSTGTNYDVSKSHSYDTTNNLIHYVIGINEKGETYTYDVTDSNGKTTQEAYSDLTITDTLTYSTYPSYGTARDVSLSSVYLYYAKLDSSGNVVYDNGQPTAGEAVPSSAYSWSYSSESNLWNGVDGTITNTITLTVPNGVPLVLIYNYAVTITGTSEVTPDTTADAKNSAVLSADGDFISEITDYTTDSDSYSTSGTSLDLNGANSYIIHKVDAENFSIALEGAQFDLYVYDASKSKFIDVDTYTTDSNGQIKAAAVEKTGTDDDGDPYTYYQLTLSNGNTYDIPVDTLCYFVESSPSSSDYKLDTTKYYFYYGSGYTTAVSDCDGYASAYAAESGDLTAINLINFPSHTEYITNEHSPEYYSDKTTLSVLKFWLDSDGNEYEKTDGSISFYLYRLFTDTQGNVTYSPDNLSGSGDQGSDPNTGSGSSTGTSAKWGIYSAYGYNGWSSTALLEGTFTYTENSDGSVTIPFSFDYYPGTTYNQYSCYNVVVSNGINSNGSPASELTVTDGSWTFASDETGGTYSGSVTIPAETEITYLAIYLTNKYDNSSDYLSNVSFGSTGSSSGGDSGSGTTASSYTVDLSYGSYYEWYSEGNSGNYKYAFDSESIEVSTDDGSTAVIKFSNLVGYDLSVSLIDWDTCEVLDAQTVSAGADYTYTLTVGSSDRTIYLYCSNGYSASDYSVSLTTDYPPTTDTGTEEGGEEQGETDPNSGGTSTDPDSGSTSSGDDSGSTETETVIGDTYYHNFSLDSFTDDNTFKILTSYKKESGSTTATESDFFDIYGNLSNSHGTCGYDLDGDGVYDDDETLTICLKMQNDPQTTITFTPLNDGVLRLAFNANGDGTESITNSCKITGGDGDYAKGETEGATNNIIEVKLPGDGETTYTITRATTCYLFYISFTEQDITVEETTDYLHSFNSGTDSNFYTITGSTGTASSSYGVVNYNNEDIIQFLKMSSKAKITFDAPESGILYFVLTDAKGYIDKGKTIGVNLDGNEKEAEWYNDQYSTISGVNADKVYLLTTRITAGTHTVTRINSTEYQLYYIGYVPDDYAHAAVYNDIPYSAYGELVYDDPITLSAANDWSWSSVTLPSEYVTAEGEVLGYYTYYIVEVDETGKYITYYKNVTTTDSDGNTTLGIASGTMGIYNTLNDENEGVTHVTVNKQWLNQKEEDVTTSSSALAAITSDTSIWVDLFAKVYVYTDSGDLYSSGKSYSRNFNSEATKPDLADSSDGFFTVSGPVNASSNVGTVTYTEDPTGDATSVSYSQYLKFQGSTVVTFDSPATSGTLTLLASNWSSTDGYSSAESIGFNLTDPDGTTYKFTYSATDGLQGSYPKGSTAVLYTDGDGTGKVSVSGNGKEAANGVIVFDIATDKEGTWTLKRNSNSIQAYLFDISFAYTYNNLADGYGVYIGSYEITADDDWSKTISGLPLYIYADGTSGSSSSATPIGYYSYYVEEQDVSGNFENPSYTYTMEVGPIVTSIELIDDTTKEIKFAYHNKYTDTIGYATTTATDYVVELDDSGNEVYITDAEDGKSYLSLTSATVVSSRITAVTKGSILVTNTAAEETFTLPSSGGSGTFKYIVAGMLTSLGAILLLYKRRKGLSAGS
ncbi:MAG: LPXTG cell wall anchor domain-containing protein [Eubacterium sp.]|nr:LPXTG cell wall anchor domain-containing protein [Eubacterium sp.]